MQLPKIVTCLLSLLWIEGFLCVNIYPPELGGGDDGSNGNAHVVGTPDTPKLEIRVLCTKDLDTSTNVNMDITVYQSDVGFKYSNIGPLDGQYVQYAYCKFINASDFLNMDELNPPDALTCASDMLDQVQSGPLDDGFATRTFRQTITFDPTLQSYDCGGFRDNNNMAVFAIYCKRDDGYDKAFDYVFVTYYDADASKCLTKQLSTYITVGDPPMVSVDREYVVEMKAYTTDDITSWPGGPISDPSKLISAPIALGTEIYLEICLSIPTPGANAPGYNQFFNDGRGPIGIYVKQCTAENDDATQTSIASVTSSVFIDDGCSKNVDPAKTLPIDTQPFKYVKDTVNANKDWLRSPNCFRSYPIEAMTFARQDLMAVSAIIYKCQIEICTSSDETKCFGTKTATDLSGYPTCPPPSGRRKRESSNITMSSRYSDVVTATVQVVPPEYFMKESKECEEPVLMITLTTILAVLLLVGMALATILTRDLISLYRKAKRIRTPCPREKMYNTPVYQIYG